MDKTPVLCIVGPTASGKTALSIRLAHALGGEIVSMDSMQIYRRMNIGTAKTTMMERDGVPHHLIDIVEPTENYTVAQYAQAADMVIHSIHAQGHLPMIVGGTGFYLRALTDGLSLGGIKSDPALRESLVREAAEPDGKRRLHDRLCAIDPISAKKLHENDIQRVSRAIEVFELTGIPISNQQRQVPERPYRFCILGTDWDRTQLYARVNARVDDMFRRGLLDEVQSLLNEGIPPGAQAMQGIGYKEIVPVIQGAVTLEDVVVRLKQNTRHYAKRQWTWFRAEERVQWLDMSQQKSNDQALRIAEAFWKEAQS